MRIDLNPTVQKLRTSATLATKLLVQKLRKEGRTIYNFGLGESPFPVSTVSQKALQDHAYRSEYLPTNGIPELRKAVSTFYKHHFDYEFHEDRVIVGPGSKELLVNAMLALDTSWMFITPSWVSYEAQARITKNRYYRIPVKYEDEYRISEKALRRVFNEIESQLENRQLATIINYPNNPTGLTLSNNEVKKIARFAKNNEIIILSDEIYANITHETYPDKHLTFGKEYPEGTIVTGGLSKDRSSGGWRVGVAVLPEHQKKLTKAFTSIGSETYSCVAAPLQYAAITAYDVTNGVSQDIDDCTSIHGLIGGVVYEHLKNQKYKVPRPEGAFYMMPSLNHFRDELGEMDIYTSKQLTERLLLEHGIAAIPGTAFGLTAEDLAFRIAYIDYNGQEMLEKYKENKDDAKSDPEEFVKSNAPSIHESFQAFEDFANKLH